MKRKAYRQVEHTADLAIEVRGRTLSDLFKNAVLAYYDLVCEMDGVTARKKLRFRIAADTPEDAFYQLLREVHYRQQAEGRLGRKAVVIVRRGKRIVLEVVVAGERFDPARHELKDEIKAVTLHGLRVSQTRRLGRTHWKAFVVFDV